MINIADLEQSNDKLAVKWSRHSHKNPMVRVQNFLSNFDPIILFGMKSSSLMTDVAILEQSNH